MKYRKVKFRIILPFNRVKDIKITGGGDVLIIFIKLVNLLILGQTYYLTHIGIIRFLNRRIFR
jgi:hypothetical protein